MTTRFRQSAGFTMIELLVSIGILATIASIMAVAYTVVMKKADATRIKFQFQTIAQALEAYKTEFNGLPVTSLDDADVIGVTTTTTADDEINRNGFRGARTLCKALMGATPQGPVNTGTVTATNPLFNTALANQDGADGFGFRVPSRSGVFRNDVAPNTDKLVGRVYGPYLATDKFKVANVASTATTVNGKTYQPGEILPGKDYDDRAVLLDGNDNPILYFPVLNPQPAISIPKAYIGDKGPTRTAQTDPLPMYRSSDNNIWLKPEKFAAMMGDTRGITVGSPPNGAIDSAIAPSTPAETPAVRGKYVLVSPGPDGFYGVNDNDVSKTAAEKAAKLDDVTNFGE